MTPDEKLMQQALEVLSFETPMGSYLELKTALRERLAERCVCGEPDTPGTHRTDGPCLAEQPAQQPAQQQEPVAHSIVAGALFDFMGWLTSRKKRIVLSSADDAGPAADAIKDFAQMRSLSINDAQVQEWQEHLAAPQPRQWQGLTQEDKQRIIDNNFGGSRADCMDEAEKVLREKNA